MFIHKDGTKLPTILSTRIIGLLCFFVAACQPPPPKPGANELAQDNDPAALVQLGEAFERSGNYPAALKFFEKAENIEPGYLAAQVARARLYVRAGQTENGIALFQEIIARDPLNDGAVKDLAGAYVVNGNTDEALELIKPLAERQTANIGVLFQAARTAAAAGDFALARVYFNRALVKQPNYTPAIRGFALSFALEGAYDSAVTVIQPLLDSPREITEGKRALALIYALSGQVEAALHIAATIDGSEPPFELRPYYILLGQLSAREQALAIFFDLVSAQSVRGENTPTPAAK